VKEGPVLSESGGRRGESAGYSIEFPERASVIGPSITGAELYSGPRGA
jgi:hypothetical protein